MIETAEPSPADRKPHAPGAPLILALLLAFAGAAHGAEAPAGNLVMKKSIGSQAAQRALEACRALAATSGWVETISVVDEAGDEITFLRMDGAGLHTIDFAKGKARTALRLQAPSSVLVDTIAKGQVQALDWGLLPATGGLPIKVAGDVVGAIGVSGSTAENDVACAQAAVAAALK